MVGRIGVEDHDHVAVDAVHALRAQPVGRVLHGEGAARGRAHHQDVLVPSSLPVVRVPFSPFTSTRLRSWVR